MFLPPQSKHELEIRAQALNGHSLQEIATALNIALPVTQQNAKGFIGQLVEKILGADPKAGSLPDFPHLGVELKTVPVDKFGKPVETTFCCAITMLQAAHEEWRHSRLKKRLSCVLWLPIQSAKVAELPQRSFGRAVLWTPSLTEEQLLKADWEDLMGAIGAGLGSKLTARLGKVLQVRPKAAHSRVRTLAPSNDGVEKTLPLGFYLRTQFTEAILKSY